MRLVVGYLPTRAIFHIFWSLTFKKMVDSWGDGKFVDHLRAEYFGTTQNGGITATWFMGAESNVVAGYPSCQNLIESFNQRVRRITRKCGHHIRVVAWLEKLERRMRTWCQSSGDKFNICGPNQEQVLCPLPFDKPSADLIKGPGRVIRTGAVHLHYPTCQSIVDAHVATGGKNIVSFQVGPVERSAEQRSAFAEWLRTADLGAAEVERSFSLCGLKRERCRQRFGQAARRNGCCPES